MAFPAYIFLEKKELGGRYNETCYLPFMWQSLYEIWEEQIRVSAMALFYLFHDHYSKNRQYNKTAAALPEVVVWEADTEGNARTRTNIPQKDGTVLEYLADASKD